MYLLNYALYIVLLLTFYTVNNTNYLKDIPFTNCRHFKTNFLFYGEILKRISKVYREVKLIVISTISTQIINNFVNL